MKTSEYKCPWEPRADDQEVSKENRSAAKEQLGMISNTYKSSILKDSIITSSDSPPKRFK